MRSDPGKFLERGKLVLDQTLRGRGYTFKIVTEGTGSGGNFAVGRYEKEDRSIELHVRHALGIVIYKVGESTLKHQDLVACLGIRREEFSYPGFSDDPLEAFEHLRHDLEGPLARFLDGSEDTRFGDCARQIASDPDHFKPGLP